METTLLKVDARAPAGSVIAQAAAVLRAGGLVAFPTETVYGLGGNALDAGAVKRIFAAAKVSDRTLTHEQIESLIGGSVPTKPGTHRLQTAPRRRRGF